MNLGMTSLDNIYRDQFNNLQRTLIEILKERSLKYHTNGLTTSNKKLQKKKIKKKIKQQMLKE